MTRKLPSKCEQSKNNCGVGIKQVSQPGWEFSEMRAFFMSTPFLLGGSMYMIFDKWTINEGNEIHNIVNKPCCYVIYSLNVPIYVGQSNYPRVRIYRHKCKSGLLHNVAIDYIKIFYPSKYGKEAMIEKRLIKKLKNLLNKKAF